MSVYLLKKNHVNWQLIASFFVFFFSLKTPIAQARENLVWQPASSQNQTNTTSPSDQSVKQVSSETTLTAQELQDTFRALQLIERLGLSFSSANQVQPMKEQLKQLPRKQSAPYQLSSAQLQTLRSIFSNLRQPQLTAINELLVNQKSENSVSLTPKAIARLRENLQTPNSRPSNSQQQQSGGSLKPLQATSKQQARSPSSEPTSIPSRRNSTVETAKPTAQSPETNLSNPGREQLLENLLLPKPSIEKISAVEEDNVPAIGLNVPSGFGATPGEFFTGVAYQGSTRGIPIGSDSGDDDAGFGLGVGLGDPEEAVGLEVVYTSFSTVRSDPFDTGGVSFKLHRKLGNTASVAFGAENLITYGDSDADTNYYGSITNIFQLQENPSDPFSSLAVTAGIGSGRFRQVEDIVDDNETVNVFGSVGLRIAEPISLVGAYTGQTLTVGTSVAPLDGIPLVITPAVTDLTGEFSDEPRFVLTIGYGTNLF
ncbi:MAG: hypothetical protein ABEI32_17085 [Halothece sp.]